jgi:hypothetical protein
VHVGVPRLDSASISLLSLPVMIMIAGEKFRTASASDLSGKLFVLPWVRLTLQHSNSEDNPTNKSPCPRPSKLLDAKALLVHVHLHVQVMASDVTHFR